MAGNTDPRFTAVDSVQWGKVTGVDGGTDGTDTDVKLVFTADATNGSLLERITIQPLSTSGSTTTSAAVARLYLNNGNDVTNAANNVLFKELQILATAVNVGAATVAELGNEFMINKSIPPGYKVYCGITAMAANTQQNVIGWGGHY
jgi:hypothetical protein